MHHCQICGVVFDIKVSKINSSFGSNTGSPRSNGSTSGNGSAVENDGRETKRRKTNRDERRYSDLKQYDGVALRSVDAEGINEMQCVLEKIRANGSPPHNLHNYEFEKGSKTFLTGVCKPNPKEGHDHGQNYNTPHIFIPTRYGVSTCDSSNVTAPGMPIHKNCFELFKIVSMRKWGMVDIDGLYWLRNKHSDSNGFMNVDRGEDVKKCRQKDRWEHHPGTEYLAANPYKPGDLEHCLSNCPVTPFDHAFGIPGPVVAPKPADSTDPFLCLQSAKDKDGNEVGQQIIDNIIHHVADKRTVTNLRLASRAFDNITQAYFKRVFTDEFSTYLWEMFDSKGNISRIPTDWGTGTEQKVDWRQFYIKLRGMNGLKNRKRIWKDTNLICDKIKKMHVKEANKAGRSSYNYTASYATPTKYFDAGNTDRRRFSISFS